MPGHEKSAGGDRTRIATELESCVLGIVAEEQPCTAYTIRRHLGASLSSYWSASAGAIYPLMRRLDSRGWIRTEEKAFGTRKRRSFLLTAEGRRRLREWLSPSDAAWSAAFTYDPIRTRVFFLGHVPRKQRLEFLDEAITHTEAALAGHSEEKEEQSATLSEFDAMGRDGAIAELDARLAWLRSVRKRIANS